jgi:hypothetical protein
LTSLLLLLALQLHLLQLQLLLDCSEQCSLLLLAETLL